MIDCVWLTRLGLREVDIDKIKEMVEDEKKQAYDKGFDDGREQGREDEYNEPSEALLGGDGYE